MPQQHCPCPVVMVLRVLLPLLPAELSRLLAAPQGWDSLDSTPRAAAELCCSSPADTTMTADTQTADRHDKVDLAGSASVPQRLLGVTMQQQLGRQTGCVASTQKYEHCDSASSTASVYCLLCSGLCWLRCQAIFLDSAASTAHRRAKHVQMQCLMHCRSVAHTVPL